MWSVVQDRMDWPYAVVVYPCSPVDSVITLMSVWRITGKIIRTAISLTYAQL